MVVVQFVTVVQVIGYAAPLNQMVCTPMGAVPVTTAMLLLIVLELMANGAATVASWFCNPVRRWLNQFLTAVGSVSAAPSHQTMPLATRDLYLASITGLHLAA